MASRNNADLYTVIDSYIENGLKKGKDLNTLLEPYRRFIPFHESCDVDTPEDLRLVLELALERLFLCINQIGKL